MEQIKKDYQKYIDEILIKYKTIDNNIKFSGKFSNGLSVVKDYKTNLYGYMDTKGNLVIPCKYNEARDFSEGLAVVSIGNNKHVIDKNGRTIYTCKKTKKIGNFHEGVAVIYIPDVNKIECIDKNGKLLFRTASKYTYREYQSLEDTLKFCNDRLKVCSCYNGKIGYIDKLGNNIIPCKYDDTTDFNKDGIAFAVKNMLDPDICFINKIGEPVFTEFTDKIENYKHGLLDFSDDAIIFNKDSAIIYNNKSLSTIKLKEGWKFNSPFKDGCALVDFNNRKKTGIVNKNGDFIISFDIKETNNICNSPFSEGLAYISKDLLFTPVIEQRYIDKNGKMVIKLEDQYEGEPFSEGLALVKERNNQIFINKSGEKVLFNSQQNELLSKINYDKDLLSYSYLDNGKKIKMRYEPLYNYDNFVVCKSPSQYFLYDKTTEEYAVLGSVHANIRCGKNFFVLNDKTYYFTKKGMTEIIDFDWSNTSSIELKEGFDLLSFDEFKTMYQKNPNYTETIKNKYLESELIKKSNAEKERQVMINKKISELTNQLNLLTSQYQQLQGYTNTNNIQKSEIALDLLFINKEGYKELNHLFIENNGLQFLDLSLIDFENVDVSNVNFSNTNAHIDPQKVYNKDMSNGVYSGLNFNLMDFDGVNICGSDFSDCIMEIVYNLEKAIKDENTILPTQNTKK